jgi:radical SAM protein with 4Fe4S-binding SPASM domain
MGEFECSTQTFCGVGRNFIFITSEGSFNLCQSLSYRQNEAFSFGHLKTDTLHDVWTQRMESFRNLRCEKQDQCAAKEKCAGGCRSRAYAVDGSLNAVDTVYCKIFGCA